MATLQSVLNAAEYELKAGCASPVIYSKSIYEVLDSFTDVPVEILCCIIDKLTPEDLASLSKVSNELRAVACDSSLWKRHCIDYAKGRACKCCGVEMQGVMTKKAAMYGWADVFKVARAFNMHASWGRVLGSPDAGRLTNLQFNEKRTTLKNLRGRWVSVQLGDFSLNPNANYSFSFSVDSFSCNGMMIGVVSSKWQGLYPGNGNAGVSATADSCAYYSHTSSIFTTGDIICLSVDLEKNVISFHKNGQIVGTVEAPKCDEGDELIVVGSFCGAQHQISIVNAYAHPPNSHVHM